MGISPYRTHLKGRRTEREASNASADSGSPYQEGFDAGLVSGSETGFAQGFEAGFLAGRKAAEKEDNRGLELIATAVQKTVFARRLFGLPCTNCGAWFYSDETHCPRCRTPKVTPEAGLVTETQ